MAFNFTYTSPNLQSLRRRSRDSIENAITKALTDVKNDWRAESVDATPLKDNALRTSIDSKVFKENTGGYVEINAMANRRGRKGNFNYAYYIHEGEGKAVTGEKKFLDKPAQQNKDKWIQWIEDEIEQELRRAGW